MTNKTDQELLEKAAKVAGVELHPTHAFNTESRVVALTANARIWNPLTNDGDAFRLLVQFELTVEVAAATTYISLHEYRIYPSIEEEHTPTQDAYAATRRAIVRAVVAIGDKQK